MKLVAGLGNPGAQYRQTRHNVGFDVVDMLARRWHVDGGRERFQALMLKGTYAGEAVVLLKPLTYMNLSGQAVSAAAGFYKVDIPDILVVADDVALPLGRLRARRGGSAGGHNGFKSVSQHLGTDGFPRLRIGVGPPLAHGAGGREDRGDLVDHVLGRFLPDERDVIEAAVLRAAEAVEAFVADGIERVMNAYNAADTGDRDSAEPAS